MPETFITTTSMLLLNSRIRLKRGLRDDLVISPYSTILASMILPIEALTNLIKLEKMEVLGKYGFYSQLIILS